jgi:hypothetical protein
MSDKELIREILACLRVNMLRGTMTTENDEQFWRFINAWGAGDSALPLSQPIVRATDKAT